VTTRTYAEAADLLTEHELFSTSAGQRTDLAAAAA
jgi:hypothetical protein